MDKQDNAHCENTAMRCTLIFTDFQMKIIFLHTTQSMSVRLTSLLELALKVSQSILRCGDGLIHGRVNMMRLLMCLMGKFSIIK